MIGAETPRTTATMLRGMIAVQRPKPEREKISGDAAQLRCHETLQDKQRI